MACRWISWATLCRTLNAAKEEFLASFRRLLRSFPADRIEDAIADAQAACLSISGDVALAGPQAAGYADMYIAVTRGLTTLQRIATLQEEVR
jgi:hypothetical protein